MFHEWKEGLTWHSSPSFDNCPSTGIIHGAWIESRLFKHPLTTEFLDKGTRIHDRRNLHSDGKDRDLCGMFPETFCT